MASGGQWRPRTPRRPSRGFSSVLGRMQGGSGAAGFFESLFGIPSERDQDRRDRRRIQAAEAESRRAERDLRRLERQIAAAPGELQRAMARFRRVDIAANQATLRRQYAFSDLQRLQTQVQPGTQPTQRQQRQIDLAQRRLFASQRAEQQAQDRRRESQATIQQRRQTAVDLQTRLPQVQAEVRQSQERADLTRSIPEARREQRRQSPYSQAQRFSEMLGDVGLGGGRLQEAVDLAGSAAGAARGDPRGMAGLARAGIRMAREKGRDLAQVPREAFAAAASTKATDFGRHAFAAGEKLSSALTGPMSPPTLLMKFGKALSDGVEQVHQWTKGVHELNMSFAEFSGAMAIVKAQQTLRDIQLGRTRGERRAPVAKELAEAKSRLDQQLASIEDKLFNTFVPFFVAIVKGINDMLNIIGPKDDKKYGDVYDPNQYDLGDQEWLDRQPPPQAVGRPPRFGPVAGAMIVTASLPLGPWVARRVQQYVMGQD